MTVEVYAMVLAALIVMAAGLLYTWPRLAGASGARLFTLAPVCVATALAVFAMEHFFDARGLAPIVPRWLPWPLFWTYLVGAALVAAAVSFTGWRCVRLAAWLLGLLFLMIVVTVDVPDVLNGPHDRLLWTLVARESAFASGAVMLACSQQARPGRAVRWLQLLARFILAGVLVFYGVEHFIFPHLVVGVPLGKSIPVWMPLRAGIAYAVGAVEVLAGAGLVFRHTRQGAAAVCGGVLLFITVLFYGPILVSEMHSNPVEGINYFSDTLLFTGTVLLAGWDLLTASGLRWASRSVPDAP